MPRFRSARSNRSRRFRTFTLRSAARSPKVNESLVDAPEKLNEDPHGDGWIVKIQLSDKNELKNLLTAAAYQEYIAAESES